MKSFFKGIFEKESSISSKRICGFLMVIWSLIAATYFIYKSLDTQNSIINNNTKDIIEYALSTGALLLGGGTVAEAISSFGSKDKDKEK